MIRIDGSVGEGGGQMLRSALSLSLATGKPFCIENIRAKRERPGLLRQHLTAVLAAGEIGSAQVEGAILGSKTLTFVPGSVRSGSYHFAVGTAGSGTLVFQTILPALMTATGPRAFIAYARARIDDDNFGIRDDCFAGVRDSTGQRCVGRLRVNIDHSTQAKKDG
jgi:RNA 3'-terminal phosphate cyclase (ATP)